MEVWKIVLIIIGGVLLLSILYSVFIYFLINKKVGRRTDKNPLLKYFTAEDYPGLKATPFAFKSGEDATLNGTFYERSGNNSDELLVFFHGYGAGHEAYTTLINDLVVATNRSLITFDYTGCDLSEGDKIPNNLQALADGHTFLQYLSESEHQNKKLILIGHSWGGFVASNLPPYNKDKKIIKVISLNGVTDFALLYRHLTRAPYLFIPVHNILNSFHYKKLAYANTRKSIKNTPIPHFFLHGLKDDSISFSPYINSLLLQSDVYRNVRFHIDKEKYHNVYLTKESENALRELQQNLKGPRRSKDNDAYLQVIKNTDFSKLVENDQEILNIITKFIKGE